MGLMRGGWIDHQKYTFDVLGTYVLVPVRVYTCTLHGRY